VLAPVGTAAANPPGDDLTWRLGDSLAYGYPYAPSTGIGYAYRLMSALLNSHPGIQLINLGCPGASTVTMLNGGGPCVGKGLYEQYGNSTNQLDAAVWLPQHNPGAVSYLTIDIGSNGVLPCFNTVTRINFHCTAKAFGKPTTSNFSIDPDSQLPINVTKICALTLLCPKPPGSAEPNIHPNRDGYQLIADTFARMFHVS